MTYNNYDALTNTFDYVQLNKDVYFKESNLNNYGVGPKVLKFKELVGPVDVICFLLCKMKVL